MNTASLNETYAVPGVLEFTDGEGGLPVAVITTERAEAAVCLYGAHVLHFRPKGWDEVFWMSATSEFEEGKPIRGGIPVCFPWFGPHADDARKPQHGFARLLMWTVAGASMLADGCFELRLAQRESPATMALWPHAFGAELIVTVGEVLDVTLSITNTGTEAFTYSDALHSYFAVSAIGNVTIHGLGGCAFYEGTGTVPRRQEEELLAIGKEENRRYVDTDAACTVRDEGLGRSIRVAKTGSRVTVVWNPWEETAKKIADMPDDGYRTMVCVEAVNAYNDLVTLRPGEHHSLGTTIGVEED